MADIEGAAGGAEFTSVWDKRPQSASHGVTTSQHHGYERDGCCYSPVTLVLVILASFCCTPAGWIARRYYAQGETSKAQLVSIFGIIGGTIVLAVVITVLVLYFNGTFG